MGIAAAIAGAAVVGGVATVASGSAAASAQKDASNQATALQQQQMAEAAREYNQNRDDLAPYRAAGATALGQISTGTAAGGEFNKTPTMADLTVDPGYQFRLDQGNKGVQASAAAQGGVLSGGTLKALARFNSDEASQEYGAAYNRYQTDTTARYNRLASIAGVGQTATNSTIAASESNTATQAAGTAAIANNINAAGNARASSYVNAGNAVGSAANSLGSYYALKSLNSYSPTAGSYGIPGSDGIY